MYTKSTKNKLPLCVIHYYLKWQYTHLLCMKNVSKQHTNQQSETARSGFRGQVNNRTGRPHCSLLMAQFTWPGSHHGSYNPITTISCSSSSSRLLKETQITLYASGKHLQRAASRPGALEPNRPRSSAGCNSWSKRPTCHRLNALPLHHATPLTYYDAFTIITLTTHI